MRELQRRRDAELRQLHRDRVLGVWRRLRARCSHQDLCAGEWVEGRQPSVERALGPASKAVCSSACCLPLMLAVCPPLFAHPPHPSALQCDEAQLCSACSTPGGPCTACFDGEPDADGKCPSTADAPECTVNGCSTCDAASPGKCLLCDTRTKTGFYTLVRGRLVGSGGGVFGLWSYNRQKARGGLQIACATTLAGPGNPPTGAACITQHHAGCWMLNAASNNAHPCSSQEPKYGKCIWTAFNVADGAAEA